MVTSDRYMTYTSTRKDGTLGPGSEQFARQLSMFNLMWRKQAFMHLGFQQDIQAARIFAIYRNPDDFCDSVVMTYPGQTITFDEASYDDPTDANCLNIEKQYIEAWYHTVEINKLDTVLFNEYVDPFQIYGSVISISTEMYTEGSDGERSVYGLFGMHFNTTLFA